MKKIITLMILALTTLSSNASEYGLTVYKGKKLLKDTPSKTLELSKAKVHKSSNNQWIRDKELINKRSFKKELTEFNQYLR